MKIFKNYIKCIALITPFLFTVVNAVVSLEYSTKGVLRKDTDNNCNINFINFGMEKNVKNIKLQIGTTINNAYRGTKNNIPSQKFNVILSNMINGNQKLNANLSFSKGELSKYIIVTQNGNPITISDVNMTTNKDYFGFTIENLETCDGLTIKQTYKEPIISHTFLLYSNVIPPTINQGFSSGLFGPSSNNTPYTIINWDMNGGLDSIREKCGIFILYDIFQSSHWSFFISIENKNLNKCTNKEFYAAAKAHFVDYTSMLEIFGDRFDGYVLKKENYDVIHVDGIVTNIQYIIEVYQKQCGKQNGNQVVCTVSSNKKLSFNEFANEIVNNCLRIIIDKNEVPQWTVNRTGITGKFSKYSLNIVNKDAGSLPTSSDGEVKYKEYSGLSSGGFARFHVGLQCFDGSYSDDNCSCHGMINFEINTLLYIYIYI